MDNNNNTVDPVSTLLEHLHESVVCCKRFENVIYHRNSNKSTIDDDDDYDVVADEDDNDLPIPSEFICPITLSLMEYPYITRWGQNFEGRAIIDWIDSGHDTCPLTRRPMQLCDILPNRQLSREIKIWMINNDLYSTDSTAHSNNNAKEHDNTTDDDGCCFDCRNNEDSCSSMSSHYMNASNKMTFDLLDAQRLTHCSLLSSSSEVQASTTATASSNDSGEEEHEVKMRRYVARRDARIRHVLSQVRVEQQTQPSVVLSKGGLLVNVKSRLRSLWIRNSHRRKDQPQAEASSVC